MYKPSADSEMEPIFFKYIVPLACTERLTVPPAHHWNKHKDFPDNVILMDKKGNRWPVKLEKVDNYVCFVDGWLDFVKDNIVEVGDFVVFENVGPNEYSVLMLDPNTACEKEILKFEEEHSGTFEESEDVIEDEYITGEEEEVEDDDEYEDEEDDDFDLEEEFIDLIQKRRMKSPHASGASNRVTDTFGNELFKSRGTPRPKNPYFVTRRRDNRNDELFVPYNVVKYYNLDLPKKTIMRDSGGAEWATKLNIWKDNRRWYCGGWGNFCRKNHVEEGEACICEFVEEAGKDLILFVYKL